MKLREAEHVVDYAISWPLAAPRDAYRAGKKYNVLVAILAGLLGIPGILLRLPVGVFAATYYYATS